jgi:hypothetical protein
MLTRTVETSNPFRVMGRNADLGLPNIFLSPRSMTADLQSKM